MLIYSLLIACVFAFVGMNIGSARNMAVPGFLLGFLLGPIGLVITCMLDGRATCPKCRRKIKGRTCTYCAIRRQTTAADPPAATPRSRPGAGQQSANFFDDLAGKPTKSASGKPQQSTNPLDFLNDEGPPRRRRP